MGQFTGSAERRDCCRGDEKVTGGEYKASAGAQLTASVTGRIWGPPTIDIEADFRVVEVIMLADLGLDVSAAANLPVSFTAARNSCTNTNCFDFTASPNITFAVQAKAEVLASVIVWGREFVLSDLEVNLAKVEISVCGKITADSCKGVSGTAGVGPLRFSAGFKYCGAEVSYVRDIWGGTK